MNINSHIFAGITRRYYLSLALRCRTGLQYSSFLKAAEGVSRPQFTSDSSEARQSPIRKAHGEPPARSRGSGAASPHPLQEAFREQALQSTPSSSQSHSGRSRRRPFQHNGQESLPTTPGNAHRAVQLSRQPPVVQDSPQAEELDASPRLLLIEAELKKHGIVLATYAEGQRNGLQCPRCKGGDSGDRSFSVRIDEEGAVWNCFRAKCGWEGGFSIGALLAESKRRATLVKPNPKLEPLSQQLLSFFQSRGISAETLRRNQIQQEGSFNGPPVIVFPYFRDGELVNLKHRTLDKRFWQIKGAEKVLYGYDDVVGASEVIIVEGEMDKLSLEEAGVRNVVSVPDGAPAKLRSTPLPTPEEEVKFSYLWNCRGLLERASRIILATDSDAPGQALAQELARRLGPERCWLVSWSQSQPSDAPADAPAPKDANEVLLRAGPAQLRACITAAQPFPIAGLTRLGNLAAEVQQHYSMGAVRLQGYSTGWRGLDQIYQVRPGCVTVLAGAPHAGKSEFADALLCNLAEQHGLKFAVCSLERKASEHAKRLLEKRVRKSFGTGAGAGVQRMSQEDLSGGMTWLDDMCVFLRRQDDAEASVAWLLDLARIAVQRHGMQGLVIDSYSTLALAQNNGLTAAGQVMTQLREFATRYNVHIWLLSHSVFPGDQGLLLSLADTGLSIQRSDSVPNKVTVSVVAVGDAVTARTGSQSFKFDPWIGRYHELR